MVTTEAYPAAVQKLQQSGFVVSTKKQEKQSRSAEMKLTNPLESGGF